MEAEIKKPPLGLIPKWLRQEERLKEIREAMLRYLEADVEIPEEWIEEFLELRKLKLNQNGTEKN
jgi:hypothetical protein